MPKIQCESYEFNGFKTKIKLCVICTFKKVLYKNLYN